MEIEDLKKYLKDSLELADFSRSTNRKYMEITQAAYDEGRVHTYNSILECLELDYLPRVQSIESARDFLRKMESKTEEMK